MTVLLDFSASASASQGQAGSKLQAAKTPWAPSGLGALGPDPGATKLDVGDRTVGLQGICECLSQEKRGRNCKLRRPRGHRLALAPASPITLLSRLMSVTVLFDFRASASASQGQAGSKLQAAKTPRAPPDLGALDPDLVVTETDVGDRTVGLQGICECLSGATRGRTCKQRRPRWGTAWPWHPRLRSGFHRG